jgi:hypothetical protein
MISSVRPIREMLTAGSALRFVKGSRRRSSRRQRATRLTRHRSASSTPSSIAGTSRAVGGRLGRLRQTGAISADNASGTSARYAVTGSGLGRGGAARVGPHKAMRLAPSILATQPASRGPRDGHPAGGDLSGARAVAFDRGRPVRSRAVCRRARASSALLMPADRRTVAGGEMHSGLTSR